MMGFTIDITLDSEIPKRYSARGAFLTVGHTVRIGGIVLGPGRILIDQGLGVTRRRWWPYRTFSAQKDVASGFRTQPNPAKASLRRAAVRHSGAIRDIVN